MNESGLVVANGHAVAELDKTVAVVEDTKDKPQGEAESIIDADSRLIDESKRQEAHDLARDGRNRMGSNLNPLNILKSIAASGATSDIQAQPGYIDAVMDAHWKPGPEDSASQPVDSIADPADVPMIDTPESSALDSGKVNTSTVDTHGPAVPKSGTNDVSVMGREVSAPDIQTDSVDGSEHQPLVVNADGVIPTESVDHQIGAFMRDGTEPSTADVVDPVGEDHDAALSPQTPDVQPLVITPDAAPQSASVVTEGDTTQTVAASTEDASSRESAGQESLKPGQNIVKPSGEIRGLEDFVSGLGQMGISLNKDSTLQDVEDQYFKITGRAMDDARAETARNAIAAAQNGGAIAVPAEHPGFFKRAVNKIWGSNQHPKMDAIKTVRESTPEGGNANADQRRESGLDDWVRFMGNQGISIDHHSTVDAVREAMSAKGMEFNTQVEESVKQAIEKAQENENDLLSKEGKTVVQAPEVATGTTNSGTETAGDPVVQAESTIGVSDEATSAPASTQPEQEVSDLNSVTEAAFPDTANKLDTSNINEVTASAFPDITPVSTEQSQVLDVAEAPSVREIPDDLVKQRAERIHNDESKSTGTEKGDWFRAKYELQEEQHPLHISNEDIEKRAAQIWRERSTGTPKSDYFHAANELYEEHLAAEQAAKSENSTDRAQIIESASSQAAEGKSVEASASAEGESDEVDPLADLSNEQLKEVQNEVLAASTSLAEDPAIKAAIEKSDLKELQKVVMEKVDKERLKGKDPKLVGIFMIALIFMLAGTLGAK